MEKEVQISPKGNAKHFDGLVRKDETKSRYEKFINQIKRTTAAIGVATLLYVAPNAKAQSPPSVVLTWNVENGDTYNVLRAQQPNGTYTLLTPTPISTTTFTDTTVQNCQTYNYVATAVNSTGQQSAYSASVTAQIPCPALAIPLNAFPPSSTAGNTYISVSGTGFTPNKLVNFGNKATFPPNTNAIIAATANSTGGWSGSYAAPWSIGVYNMIAIDAVGFSATGTVIVTSQKPTLTLPVVFPPSSSAGNTNVSVAVAGFSPDATVNIGKPPMPPYNTSLIAPTTNSSGAASGNITAPWSVGIYPMMAIDQNGLTALANLIVTAQKATLTLPAQVLPSSSTSGCSTVTATVAGFSPSVIDNVGYANVFPPAKYAIASTTTNSNGSGTLSWCAPYSAGSYPMNAVDANGIAASATLVVE